MANSFTRLAFAILLALAGPLIAFAQESGPRWLDVEFPRGSPVLPESFSLGSTSARVRGMSMALDIHSSLVLRNTGTKTISGLTLRVAGAGSHAFRPRLGHSAQSHRSSGRSCPGKNRHGITPALQCAKSEWTDGEGVARLRFVQRPDFLWPR